jgi:hypothetical protein
LLELRRELRPIQTQQPLLLDYYFFHHKSEQNKVQILFIVVASDKLRTCGDIVHQYSDGGKESRQKIVNTCGKIRVDGR